MAYVIGCGFGWIWLKAREAGNSKKHKLVQTIHSARQKDLPMPCRIKARGNTEHTKEKKEAREEGLS